MAGATHIAPLSLIVLPPRRIPRAAVPAGTLPILDRHIRPSSGSPRARTLPLAIPGREKVRQAHHARADRVADHRAVAGRHDPGALRKSQSQPAVHDSKDNHRAAEPDMSIRPDSAGIIALEEDVVQESQQRLENQQREDDDADDGVRVVKRVEVARHPHSDAEGGGVQ